MEKMFRDLVAEVWLLIPIERCDHLPIVESLREGSSLCPSDEIDVIVPPGWYDEERGESRQVAILMFSWLECFRRDLDRVDLCLLGIELLSS